MMATTGHEGFRLFLEKITPSESERTNAASHRASIEAKLEEEFGLYRMFETGSFRHGTGVSVWSDVDYFVSLKSMQPMRSASILASVREALLERFPSTYIHVSRPAVVLDFANGRETVEVIPAYAISSQTDGMKFQIPGVVDEWLESTPEAHLKYVNDCNKLPKNGAAKSLARLIKAWKYYRDVPISSFYLEMRAATYMANETSVSYPYDIYRILKQLQDNGLAAMNDPTGNTGRIYACSSTAKRAEALTKLDRAVTRARNAKDYYADGKIKLAFEQWDLLFNGRFPSYG
jgi:hypothetical protein